MASRCLFVPEFLHDSPPGLYGDVDTFIASYESGEQCGYWKMMHDKVHSFLDGIVRIEMNAHRGQGVALCDPGFFSEEIV